METTGSRTLNKVRVLVRAGDVMISEHGYDELAEDNISVREVIDGMKRVVAVEDYPDYVKGPCVLALQFDGDGRPIHVVWGIPRGQSSPAVLVTAYRPDPLRWDDGFRRRKA